MRRLRSLGDALVWIACVAILISAILGVSAFNRWTNLP